MSRDTLAIYGLPEEYQALADIPMEGDQADDPEALRAMLEALAEVKAEEKVLRLAKVCQQLGDEAALLEQRAAEIIRRAASRRKRAKDLQAWMQMLMEGHGIPKAKDAFISVWLQKNPASISIVNEVLVPDDFKRATLTLPVRQLPDELRMHPSCVVQVMKSEVMAYIGETGEVPRGCEYVNDKKNLRIK